MKYISLNIHEALTFDEKTFECSHMKEIHIQYYQKCAI